MPTTSLPPRSLSGNRNFEGRVSPDVRANYLASPPLVVAYALKGTVRQSLVDEPIGQDRDGADVWLKDIWPSNEEVRSTIEQFVNGDMYRSRYADVYKGDERWRSIAVAGGETYAWSAGSTYIQNPPYFEGMSMTPVPIEDINGANALAVFGDSITTDHISPAGSIKADSPGGIYLTEHQVSRADFNSYGARRGNHEVMMRGTFANIRIKNAMTPGIEGRRHQICADRQDDGDLRRCHALQGDRTPLVVIAGKEYGTGSSRDWRPRAPNCSASAPSSPRPMSASTAPTWSAWACCRCSSWPARIARLWASPATSSSPSPASPICSRARKWW